MEHTVLSVWNVSVQMYSVEKLDQAFCGNLCGTWKTQCNNYSHCGITPSPYRGIQLVEWFNMVVMVLVSRVSKRTPEGGGGVEGDISQICMQVHTTSQQYYHH